MLNETRGAVSFILLLIIVIAISVAFIGGFSPLAKNPPTDTTIYNIMDFSNQPAKNSLQLMSPVFIRPTPAPSSSPAPTPTPGPTLSPTPTPIPTPTLSPGPTSSPRPTHRPTPPPTPTPTPTPGSPVN